SHPRPVLSRSRSHTNPTRSDASPERSQFVAPPSARHPLTRPQHTRAKSYLAPEDSKSHSRAALLAAPATAAFEKTAEKLPRLHLPGSSHRQHHHSQSHSSSGQNHSPGKNVSHRRHRHTQSEAHPGSHNPKHDKDRNTASTLPHLVARLNAEKERRTLQTTLFSNDNAYSHNNLSSSSPQSSRYADLQRTFGPSESTNADYNNGGRYDLHRRATSDTDQLPMVQKTSFELLLERGDQTRFARRLHVKKDDIIRRDAELAEAEDEMRSRVNEITATGVDMTRRLDYGYYNLLEKLNNLIGTITSFQSLSKQTGQLVHNFEKETHRLETDTRHRAATFQETFQARDQRATELSQRGKTASRRAEDLSQRLENARMILENWEQREASNRRAWVRVNTVCWYTMVSIALLFLALILVKEWCFHGDPVQAGLGLHRDAGHWNKSLRLGVETHHGSPADNERIL
ncbi:uncharacterized protein A1O9_01500, partial [Exophiala aquamarina CBS 119918]